MHLRRGGDAPVLGNARVDARELRERDERDQAVGRGQARVREVLRGGDGAGSEARTARRRAERLPVALARGRRRARVHAPQRGDRATSRTHPTARREARGGSRGRPWRPRRAKCACERLILGRCSFISRAKLRRSACPSHFPLAFSSRVRVLSIGGATPPRGDAAMARGRQRPRDEHVLDQVRPLVASILESPLEHRAEASAEPDEKMRPPTRPLPAPLRETRCAPRT